MDAIFTLSNKVALITGASQGLGTHYAEVLAQHGATVIVSGRSSASDRLQEVVQKIKEKGGNAIPLILDMTDFESFNLKIASVIETVGHIDILVNNAAVSVDKSLFEISHTDWDLHMDTNLKGLFFLSQAVANHMKNQPQGGSIINIAAINGEKIRKNCISFGVSKAGVIHLTKAMAYELIDYKIRVNGLVLGLFPSAAVKTWLENDPTSQNYINQIPAKRAGRFTDLDGPLLLLASDTSHYMTGSMIKVDGGFAIDVFMGLDIQHA